MGIYRKAIKRSVMVSLGVRMFFTYENEMQIRHTYLLLFQLGFFIKNDTWFLMKRLQMHPIFYCIPKI